MTTRSYVRIFSFVLAAVSVLAGYAIINMNHANSYKMQLENSYQQSLNELSENLDAIETNLTKSIYSNSDKMLLEISSDLYAECGEAKDALSRLPVSQMNLGSTYKFISQASDYSTYIAKKIASGEKITDEEHKNLSTLLNYSRKLNDSVEGMVSICNSGGKITASNVKNKANINVNAISADMTAAEEAFNNYPTLLYDGPFADAVLNREPQMIKNKDYISKEQAREIAATALNCNINQVGNANDEEGKIPCYTFTCGQKNIGISKQGGYVAYILYGGKITQASITEDNARNIAKSYLKSIGYENMAETYYMTNDNICVINYAYSQNGITYYSDLIKVGISMADGKVLSLEAEGFLTNHIERKAFTEKIKLDDIKKNASPYLKILDTKKCVIPKENGLEIECFELHCESSETGEEVLIYVNAQTGAEENILLLLYSDGGTLTK